MTDNSFLFLWSIFHEFLNLVHQSCQEIKAWEESMQRRLIQQNHHWFPFLKKQGRKAITFVYQYSLIPLGVELIPWLGLSLEKLLPTTWIAHMKVMIQESIKNLVFFFTLSPHLAEQSYEAMGQKLNRENMKFTFQALGASTGIMLTYSAGSYSLLRMMGMSGLAVHMNHWLQKARLDDKKARAKKLTNWKRDPRLCFYTLSLGLTVLEGIYLRSIQPFILMAGGLGGSLALVKASQELHFDQHFTKELSVEDKRFLLFLFSSLGYELGFLLTQASYERLSLLIREYQLREQVIAYLQECEVQGRLSELSIEQPSLMTSLRHWVKQEHPLTFEWRNPYHFFYRANCQIKEQHDPVLHTEVQCAITPLPARLINSG